MTWTDPQDVIGTWLGGDAPQDVDLVQRWIERAEREVRRRVPDIEDRLIAGTEADLLDTLRDVVAAMVTRVFRNPQGIRQVQETTGPFSLGQTYSGESPGVLSMTNAELAALAGAAGRPRAFEIDTSPAPLVTTYLTPDAWI